MRPDSAKIIQNHPLRLEMVTPDSVAKARRLLAPLFPPSRVHFAETLGAYLKLENDLPTGTFKVRGAVYALTQRMESAAVREVVPASTGNHGAAVAYAAHERRISATIFVPCGSNPVKLARIRRLGGAIHEIGATLAESIDHAADHAIRRGAYFLHDATDPNVPAGAATIASELMEQVSDLDRIYVPVGDTALIRGVAAEAKRIRPSVRIIGVQARNAPAYFRSWQSGDVIVTDSANTIADGLATTRPIAENVGCIRELVDEMILVTEAELLDAIGCLLFQEHLVAEPAAAAPLAAFQKTGSAELRTALLITGSNISSELLKHATVAFQPKAP